jgi:ABC-2 type transport system ATP-binding protein
MKALPLEAISVTKRFGHSGSAPWRRLLRRDDGHARREVRAVDGVSFHIRHGEIYGVLGANGSGKSTLIRMVSTLLLPDEGRISIFGLDVVRQSMAVRRLINRVSADPSFFRNMSAAENLLFFGRVYGLTPDEVKEKAPAILRRLGMGREKSRETMTNLSRGQQQKVAVARAFLTSPVLMLLDEPTTGLDPRSKRDVQGFIREVRAEHDATILLTTHDMEEAELLCDRIAFIAGGRIVAEGTPLALREGVAGQLGMGLSDVSMETVFMHITGRSIEEDEEEDDGADRGSQPTDAKGVAEMVALAAGAGSADLPPHIETEARHERR